MEKAKELLLEDALETAIKSEKENIKLRRIISILSIICGTLSIICICKKV